MPEPKSEKHKANWAPDYFQAHDGKLKELQGKGIVQSTSLTTDPLYPNKTPHIKMKGSVKLADGSYVDVSKKMRVVHLPTLNTYKIFTIKYKYTLIDRNDQKVFRYCSVHDEKPDSPHHHKFHHKHEFDETGQETVKTLTEDEWPTLGEVLDEAAEHINWEEVHR